MGLFQKCLTVLVTWSNQNSVLHSFLLGRVAELGGVKELFKSEYTTPACVHEGEGGEWTPSSFQSLHKEQRLLPEYEGKPQLPVDGPSQKDTASNGCLSTLLVQKEIILHIFCMSLNVSIKPRPFGSAGGIVDFCCGSLHFAEEEEAEVVRVQEMQLAILQKLVNRNAETPRQFSLPTNQSSGNLPANQSELRQSAVPTVQRAGSQLCQIGVQATRPFRREVVMGLCRSLLVFCRLIFSWKHVPIFIFGYFILLYFLRERGKGSVYKKFCNHLPFILF